MYAFQVSYRLRSASILQRGLQSRVRGVGFAGDAAPRHTEPAVPLRERRADGRIKVVRVARRLGSAGAGVTYTYLWNMHPSVERSCRIQLNWIVRDARCGANSELTDRPRAIAAVDGQSRSQHRGVYAMPASSWFAGDAEAVHRLGRHCVAPGGAVVEHS